MKSKHRSSQIRNARPRKHPTVNAVARTKARMPCILARRVSGAAHSSLCRTHARTYWAQSQGRSSRCERCSASQLSLSGPTSIRPVRFLRFTSCCRSPNATTNVPMTSAAYFHTVFQPYSTLKPCRSHLRQAVTQIGRCRPKPFRVTALAPRTSLPAHCPGHVVARDARIDTHHHANSGARRLLIIVEGALEKAV